MNDIPDDDWKEAPAPDEQTPATTPRRRFGLLRRRSAAVATTAGLAAGGLVGGYLVSHAATTTATPSDTASSTSSSSSSTSSARTFSSNENPAHESGEASQREAAENSGQFPGPGGPHERGLRSEDQDVVAKAIGISTAQLQSELSGGKTIAQVAQAHGADVNALISTWVASENKEIDDRVAAGQLTQAQADQMKSMTQQRVTDEVNGTFHGGHWGGPRDGSSQSSSSSTGA